MKTYKYITLLLLFIVVITGCKKDLLDIVPLDAINPESFFKNEKEADIALTGIYSALGEYVIYFDAMSDDFYNKYPWEGATEIGRGTHGSTSGYIKWKWQANYTGIARANLFIVNLEGADVPDDVKAEMIAQAKFLRAYWYADLADFYEDVPLILEPQQLADANTPKSTKADVITAVLKDLDDAAAGLKTSHSGGDIGCATKGAALALKTRVLLYNERWAEAASAAKEVMELGYSLYPSYEGLFKVEAENNEEVIFDSQFIKDKRRSGYTTILKKWRSIQALIGLTNDYYTADGKPITDETSGYDPANPFDNRDPRMAASLQLPGNEVNGDVYIPADDRNMETSLAPNKWVEWDNNEYWNSEINIILIRYADVLLMYAEAQNEAVGPDASVYDAIKDVRARAGMPDVTPGLNKDQMREEIRHERRIEFALEGLRYSDIRRWKIAEDVMVDGKGYDKTKLTDPSDPASWIFEEIVVDERTFDPSKHYVWPIPQVEIETNSELEQNPAWN